MAQFVIQGGAPLGGEIAVSGAKNSVLKLIAGAILLKGETKITRVPQAQDMFRMSEILSSVGAKVESEGAVLRIHTDTIIQTTLPRELVKRLRASTVLIGPMLARHGEVRLAYPGGCVLGKRPIDLFVASMRALGAEVEESEEEFIFRAKKLKGAEYFFPFISVTATENMMMAATLAEGRTIIKNAACEPEIPHLAEFLNTCGARITGAGTHTIVIDGVLELHGGEVETVPDRIETGTFAILAAAARAQIKITHCQPDHVEGLWAMFDRIGIPYTIGQDWIEIQKTDKPYKAVEVTTKEYPGFMTDLQPPFTVLLTQAQGMSLVHETIYDGRLFYLDKLSTMGAYTLLCDPHRAVVQGPRKLHGKQLESPDLRAGIALVIAGLIAEGTTTIDNIYQIERGYERIDERLRGLGAHIERINDTKLQE
ncbi:MAG TPA: UDP-N-acetylglucosamine 1-carboxyvinyltransferase [Candidatus Magasanikbacteria bacterium]|nr:UDP-N-acetylglucosamine 1-carboxyvinyltransferase [Candidatus Magasanikbacteria bacterium]